MTKIQSGWSDLVEETITQPSKEATEPQPKQEPVGRKRVTKKVDRDGAPIKRLLYGRASTGKTRAAIHFFCNRLKENKNTICWYIDTERGLIQTLREFEEDIDENIEYFECFNFTDAINALKLILENAQKGDIIIIDMLSVLWDWSQEQYTMEVFDKDMSKFYLSRRKEIVEKRSGAPVMDGWKDWVGIKLLHNHDFIDEFVKQTGADLICICSAKRVDMNEEGKPPVLNPTIFTPIGFAPEGEKHNEHRFDTIIYFECGEDNWYTIAPKFRGNYDMLRRKITIPPKEFPEI